MAPHSSTLAWKIPWTEDPLQCSCLENPRDGGALWSAMSSADTCAAQKKALYEMLMPQSLTGRGLNTQTVNQILLAREEGCRHQ